MRTLISTGLDGLTTGANNMTIAGYVITRDIELDSVCLGKSARYIPRRGGPNNTRKQPSL